MLDLLVQSLYFPMFFLLFSFPLSIALFFWEISSTLPSYSPNEFSFLPLSFYISQELPFFLDYFVFIAFCYLTDMVLCIPEDFQLFFFWHVLYMLRVVSPSLLLSWSLSQSLEIHFCLFMFESDVLNSIREF